MASTVKGCIQVLAAAAALALPNLAKAADQISEISESSALTLQTDAKSSTQNTAGDLQKNGEVKPIEADAAPAPESPNIHGFFNSPFKTAYVTPRGLVVQNAGLVWQPVVGLVFPLEDLSIFKKTSFVGGIWNSVDTAEAGGDPRVGPWDEMDVFASFNATVADNFGLSLTYGAWNFPQATGPHTEHNLDLKVTYDDSKLWGNSGWAFHPYADFWWAISGSSTVVLGRQGSTGYIELGLTPTYTWKASADYPVTLTFPAYISIGPSNYWDEHGTITTSHFGLVSASANASVPLAFIPTKYGFWHADLGVTYDYLINDSLLAAGGIVSGNTNHNVIIGSLGFGVNF
jgi:hypothetical protein